MALYTYRCEAKRMNLNALCSNVFFLELARDVSLDKGGLPEDMSARAPNQVPRPTTTTL